jgi:hypothetical protein
MLINGVPLHDFTVGMSAPRITGLIFLSETINSLILTPFLEHLCDYERNYALFTARQFNSSHNNKFYTVFTGCFWQQNNELGIVASSFNMYSNNARTKDILKESI